MMSGRENILTNLFSFLASELGTILYVIFIISAIICFILLHLMDEWDTV